MNIFRRMWNEFTGANITQEQRERGAYQAQHRKRRPSGLAVIQALQGDVTPYVAEKAARENAAAIIQALQEGRPRP